MQQINSIIKRMEEIFNGEPWYGKSLMKVLNEVDPSRVYEKPSNGSHSLIELLYHMITWVEFTLHALECRELINPEKFEQLDWRQTNPGIHTWNTGIADITAAHNKIIIHLHNASEDLLEAKVSHREYNMRFLLNGLTDHIIYHTGQIAYLNKLFR